MWPKKIMLITGLLVLLLTVNIIAQINNEAELLYLTGRNLTFERKYTEAIDTLKASYSLNPENPRVLHLLGDIYIKIGNMPGAEQAFNQIRELQPHKSQGYVKLAELYWHLGEFTDALAYLHTAQQLQDPPDEDVYRWLGQIYRSQDKLFESDSVLKEGLRHYSENPELLACYGTTLIYIGDSAGARISIDSAYYMDSNSVYVVNTRASYKMFTGDIPGASAMIEQAVSLDPDDPFTRSNINAYSAAYKKTKALNLFENGNANFAKSLYSKARKDYLLALGEDSAFFEVLINLGFTYIHLGEMENASNSFEKALTINPNYSRGYIGWGDALIALGQIEAGFEKYKQALALDPDNMDIKEIYEQLKQAKAAMDANSE